MHRYDKAVKNSLPQLLMPAGASPEERANITYIRTAVQLKEAAMQSMAKGVQIVTQFNHPQELDSDVAKAVQELLLQGYRLHNRAVLMHGINDDVQVLVQLMNRLAELGFCGSSLFQCHPNEGDAGYSLPLPHSARIVRQTKDTLTGMEKRFPFLINHHSGIVAVVGTVARPVMLFRYFLEQKESDRNRLFVLNIDDAQCWLPDAIPATFDNR